MKQVKWFNYIFAQYVYIHSKPYMYTWRTSPPFILSQKSRLFPSTD